MIRVTNLHIRAGQFELDKINFEIPSGKYGVLMGKTGSGKTTLLEAICGLKTVLGGAIVLGQRNVTHLKPAERNIGLVPQDGALFPTMTVREQLAFALDIRKSPPAHQKAVVAHLAELLEIEHLLDRTPQGLSGGERQRVSLGRALSFGPETLCLDEPLSALDDNTRTQIIELLRRIQHETGVTCLHVTHSEHEAELLGDVRLHIEDRQLTTTVATPEDKKALPR